MLVPGCLSCDILAGKRAVPGGMIYENDHWFVSSVVEPVVWPGFLVIVLRRHCEQLAELIAEEASTLGPTMHATCQALSEVLHPAKIYVCSFGDGVKHIHFWALPRPTDMAPGMHPVMLNLDLRMTLTRRLGVKKWTCSEAEVTEMADRLRQQFRLHLPTTQEALSEQG
jgi:diadenosine tetraphosphate (Ap4A) HIT family hydrolase